jgi:hypothetical protein
MVTLKSGIKTPKALVEYLSSEETVTLEWISKKLGPHPDMDDRQWAIIPVSANQIPLPRELIAYYTLTKVAGKEGDEEFFVLKDGSKYILPGIKGYNHARSIPVETKAESRVLNVLRNFAKAGWRQADRKVADSTSNIL